MDLRDLYEPHGGPSRLTWARLRTLWARLPPEAHAVTAFRESAPADELRAADPGTGPWSKAEMLAADVIDAIERLSYYLLKVNGNDVPQPKPVPRPGVARQQRHQLTDAQRAHLDALRNHNRTLREDAS